MVEPAPNAMHAFGVRAFMGSGVGEADRIHGEGISTGIGEMIGDMTAGGIRKHTKMECCNR